jgi:aldehyde:ferredoxin oxidoreductase
MTEKETFGWAGTVLRVDLNAGEVAKRPLEKEAGINFIGGRGLNSKVLFDEVEAGVDPLSPDNVLCLAVGPLTGTSLTSTCRIEVSTISPLSNILGDGNSGGYFPAFLKFAGYDQIVVKGRASKPVYLLIDDDEVELRDASGLWGKNTWETTDALREEHGEDFWVASIGQAGENLVRFASFIFDRHNSAARGSGAVAGAKNFKAIAVRGTGKPRIAKPEEFKELADEDRKHFLTDKIQREVAKYGTHLGMLKWWPGFRYFQKYLDEKGVPEELRPEGWKKYEVRRYACMGCGA